MILAIDTSTANCSAALFDASGACIASRDELIGRGHAERLVPMIEEMLAGKSVRTILVGVGPGSFTGLRVGIAAAHGLAIGWGASLQGLSSLALLAAIEERPGPVAAAMAGGHGELFVQQFGDLLEPVTAVLNLPPTAAAEAISARRVVGPAAAQLVESRGWGEPVECWPSAANALLLPESLRGLEAKPFYARAPDARVRSAA
ncbi:MAG TPA: tRNA (adenosine(37)-N6)-threonylcarbamoyltransferase complex dimerization subunit type 1 TsaB [Sphingomicrobium sp.]|nr:tRNA (adenosine(37)-N6)-threonylcarbamoyltransferase complex dimerization subunit type 1 TsaB [Sphingomicrobium sp.]